jgi:glycosyltransferase involved in cell wall biosynthesis
VKIFIGNTDIGSMISDFKIQFNALGIETLTAVDEEQSAITRGKVDYNFAAYKKRYFGGVRPRSLQKFLQDYYDIKNRIWRKALRECDTFIFIWNSFKKDYSDFAELKKRNKKIVVIMVGDDVRWYHAAKQEFMHYKMPVPEYDQDYSYGLQGLKQRLSHIRMAEKYADFIFSRLDQAQLQLRPYYRWNMMVMPSHIPFNPIQNEKKPKVLHAPSNRKVKGTEYVLNAFEKLKENKIELEPVLMENVPNEKAVKMYAEADIVIDQLIFPGTGKLSTEALAAGKVVMSHMAYDRYPQKNPNECPIIDVNPENVYERLATTISNYRLRADLAGKARPYVEKYLDLKIFCEKVIELCNGVDHHPDYTPEFFREKFIPESEESIPLYNEWTKTVTECGWYKKNVKSGNRAGLEF